MGVFRLYDFRLRVEDYFGATPEGSALEEGCSEFSSDCDVDYYCRFSCSGCTHGFPWPDKVLKLLRFGVEDGKMQGARGVVVLPLNLLWFLPGSKLHGSSVP